MAEIINTVTRELPKIEEKVQVGSSFDLEPGCWNTPEYLHSLTQARESVCLLFLQLYIPTTAVRLADAWLNLRKRIMHLSWVIIGSTPLGAVFVKNERRNKEF
jgi:hypothetical protein